MDLIQKELLEEIAGLHEVPAGAYNIRANGKAAARNTTANIDIVTKEDKDGIDINAIKEIKETNRERIKEYTKYHPDAIYTEGKYHWDIPCDIALPCATQNELNESEAQNLITNKVIAVAEGANMPTTINATKLLQTNGILFAPGKAANAGGVAVSALEMSQNSIRLSWDFDEVDQKLDQIMTNIFNEISSAAKKYSNCTDYVSGANIAGFTKVADAMIAQGAV